ncbi:hypothetical protein WJ542_11710 [Paraburkholderia sp. B3]|uniref:hypothetical protein n=1 Tax=Paraburkholderia sp. B3 TaxID=3134791 RepID=UPI003982256D
MDKLTAEIPHVTASIRALRAVIRQHVGHARQDKANAFLKDVEKAVNYGKTWSAPSFWATR